MALSSFSTQLCTEGPKGYIDSSQNSCTFWEEYSDNESVLESLRDSSKCLVYVSSASSLWSRGEWSESMPETLVANYHCRCVDKAVAPLSGIFFRHCKIIIVCAAWWRVYAMGRFVKTTTAIKVAQWIWQRQHLLFSLRRSPRCSQPQSDGVQRSHIRSPGMTRVTTSPVKNVRL